MLASGRPVVATALPGTALAKEVEGAGVLTPPGDAQAFAAAITGLLDDSDRREALGAQGRTHAIERWDMKAIINLLESQFEELVSPAS